MTRFSRLVFLLLLCSISFLSGCSETRYIMRFETDNQEHVWPAEPEKPRFRYIGQLTGEENFVRADGEEGGFSVGDAFRWLAGLITGKSTPVVLQRPQTGVYDVDNKRLYVSDVSRQAVYLFDEDKGKIQVWDTAFGATGFISPIGLALLGRELYVADADLKQVTVLDAQSGESIRTFGLGLFTRPTGLAINEQKGWVYVSDTHDHTIKVFSLKGDLVKTIGKRGTENGEFNGPTYLAFARGHLYVTDAFNARVQVLDAEGAYVKSFGSRGIYVGQMPRPKGVAVDNNENIYVIESYHDYLLVFNQKGEFLLPIGGTGYGPGQFYLPAGVWTDSNKRVYIADMFNGRVEVFEYIGE